MSFFENTRKPVGFGGKVMVVMMNVGHSPVARWGLQFLNAAPDAKVLDCGCGTLTIRSALAARTRRGTCVFAGLRSTTADFLSSIGRRSTCLFPGLRSIRDV